MRITQFMVYDQLKQAIQNTQAYYARINNQLGAQKKILAPSDDVSGTLRALDYQVSISANDQFKKNVDNASTNLNLTDTALSSFSDAVAQVKDVLFSSLNGNSDTLIRSANAQKTAQMRDQLLDMANTSVGGAYLFSGFRTSTRAYNTATYAYQGDNGNVSVPIDHGTTMAMNITGSSAFSYTLGAAYTKQIPSGMNVHYTPGAGTTVNVEIRDATDATVLDTFSFSNVMQMTDILSSAVNANDVDRIQALVDPFNSVQDQLAVASASVGSRLSSLKDQSTLLSQNTTALKNSLSTIQDVDMAETAMLLQKADTTLQALYTASSNIMSKSLLDFLQ